MDKGKWWVLAMIVALAALLRLVWLDKYPLGFTPDEAAFGYNAYSLFQTGHDEWGTPFWQLPAKNLRSFGDYKLPLYAFLAVPSVAIFGLNEFATRLPNAILGSLSVIGVYLLTKLLFAKSKIAEVSTILLAISPWALPLSRGAFEANLIICFLPLAICLLLRRNYTLSIIIFSLSLYSYHSVRIVAPLALVGLLVVYKLNLKLNFYQLLLLLLLVTPVFYSLVFSNARAADVSIFHLDDNWAAMADTRLYLIRSGWPHQLARLAANKITFPTVTFAKNYLSYFSPKFLFVSGPAEATYGMLPGVGTIYLVQLPFLATFVYLLIRTKNQNYYYLLLLLLISPIPAALAKGPGFAANRAAFMVIPLTLMSAFTAGFIVSKIKKPVAVLLLLLLVLSAGKYLANYVLLSPNISARSMGYGFRQLAGFVSSEMANYDQVRISRSLSEPHVFLAFYLHINPHAYQSASRSWSDFEAKGFRFLDQYDGYYLGNVRFGDLNFERRDPGRILYIGRPDDFPAGIQPEKTIFYPDGSPGIIITKS